MSLATGNLLGYGDQLAIEIAAPFTLWAHGRDRFLRAPVLALRGLGLGVRTHGEGVRFRTSDGRDAPDRLGGA